MKTIQITISIFFFLCLFNVAFIPQLCLNVINDLQHNEVTNNIFGEESTSGLNIFEEESKEPSKENNENENNTFNIKLSGCSLAFFHNILLESWVNNIFHSTLYQSIAILKITPPPKL